MNHNGRMSYFSTQINYAFLSTANSFQVQLNSYYQSTTNVTYSTVNSLQSLSSFNYLISSQGILYSEALSTMSTGIGLQDAITSTLILNYVNNQISTIAYYSGSTSTINALSTSINYALLSTSTGVSNNNNNNNLLSTSTGLQNNIDDIDNFTQYLNLAIGYNSSAILSSTGNLTSSVNGLVPNVAYLNNYVVSLSGEVSTLAFDVSLISTNNTIDIIFLSTSIGTTNQQLSSLNSQVSTITTSSILEGIYVTFIELEAYTVNLINSTTIAADNSFINLQLSTINFLESTNTAYVEFLSAALSTQSFAVTSTLTSSISYLLSTFVSTTTTTLNNLSTQVSTVSGNVSTSLSSIQGDLDTALSTFSGQISTSLYTLSGEISTLASSANSIVSSINGVQLITLDSNNFIGILDFNNYRNFNIQVRNIQDIVDDPQYSVSFKPNTLSNNTLQQGTILLDISTNTQSYTQYGNKMFLNFNQWGTINNNYTNFPMLADSAYKMEFIYSLYNKNLYTSLTNIWPYQNTYNLYVSSINDNTNIDPSYIGIFSTGTQLELTWQNYLFSTFINGYSSFVAIDVDISGSIQFTYGPYPYTISSATISMPSGGYPASTGFVSTNFFSYIVGEPSQSSKFEAVSFYP